MDKRKSTRHNREEAEGENTAFVTEEALPELTAEERDMVAAEEEENNLVARVAEAKGELSSRFSDWADGIGSLTQGEAGAADRLINSLPRVDGISEDPEVQQGIGQHYEMLLSNYSDQLRSEGFEDLVAKIEQRAWGGSVWDAAEVKEPETLQRPEPEKLKNLEEEKVKAEAEKELEDAARVFEWNGKNAAERVGWAGQVLDKPQVIDSHLDEAEGIIGSLTKQQQRLVEGINIALASPALGLTYKQDLKARAQQLYFKIAEWKAKIAVDIAQQRQRAENLRYDILERALPAAERDSYDFDKIKQILAEKVGNKAKIVKADITSTPNGAKISATLDAGLTGGKITLNGEIVNSGQGIAITNLQIEARGYVKNLIQANLGGLPEAIKKYFEEKSGKKISSIQIEGEHLIVEHAGEKKAIPKPAPVVIPSPDFDRTSPFVVLEVADMTPAAKIEVRSARLAVAEIPKAVETGEKFNIDTATREQLELLARHPDVVEYHNLTWETYILEKDVSKPEILAKVKAGFENQWALEFKMLIKQGVDEGFIEGLEEFLKEQRKAQ